MAALTATDRELMHAVLDEIRWDPEVDGADVRVDVIDGVVLLKGTVDSAWKKRAAERAARRVPGVRSVANEIDVKPRRPASDSELTAAVLEALERDPLVPEDQITVTVRHGVVILEGDVDLAIQREEAERAARQTPGVIDVANEIVVKPVHDSDAAADVARNILRALVRAAEADAERIEVSVEAGHVTLTGVVRSSLSRTEAERAAWRTPGVVAVRNRIFVKAD
jgi:osmotically-inducible protein OsmY